VLRLTSVREARAAVRREAWVASRQSMADYLRSPEWYAKRDRAFIIWRCIGWTVTAGPLAAFWLFADSLHGSARILLAWPIQDFAVFGFVYAGWVRLLSSRNGRLKRVGHHIGYTHVDTARGIYRERWYEIVPATQAVNRTESLLRHDRPSPGFWPYLRRTLVAVALVRFWWVAVVFGGLVYWWGFSPTLTWLEQVGHRL